MPLEPIVKVFAPIKVNSFVMEFLIESIAVSIPTRAVIPTAIIITVNTVRSKLLRIDCKAIFRFSKKSVPNLISLLFDALLIGRTRSQIITSIIIPSRIEMNGVWIFLKAISRRIGRNIRFFKDGFFDIV
jgi:hypothetical protein